MVSTDHPTPNTLTVTDGQRHKIALLSDDQAYWANIVDLEEYGDGDYGDEVWIPAVIEANVALCGADGTTAFYLVETDDIGDQIFYPVATFPPGHLGLYRVIDKDEVSPDEDDEDEVVDEDDEPEEIEDPVQTEPTDTASSGWQDRYERFRTEGLSDGLAAQMADVSAAAQGRATQRDEILADIRQGNYPQDAGIAPPKKLSDVWEGKGDPDPDGFGVVAELPTEGVEHTPSITDLPYDDGGDFASWVAKRQAQFDREAERLREVSDLLTSEANRPQHLAPEKVEPWHGKATEPF